MSIPLRPLVCAAFGIAAAASMTSCVDPYYSSTSVGYSSGGYGYGGYGGSTSIFVSTGDPVWGYDPYTYCYYNYSSRRYYDPYLYGYYPVGYRPSRIYGAPHPCGWHPGLTRIDPPRRVNNYTLRNYNDRVGSYRSGGFNWSKQVRSGGDDDRKFDSSHWKPSGNNNYNGGSNYNPRSGSNSGFNNQWNNNNNNWNKGNSDKPKFTYPDRNDERRSLPPRYNSPVTVQPDRSWQGGGSDNSHFKPSGNFNPGNARIQPSGNFNPDNARVKPSGNFNPGNARIQPNGNFNPGSSRGNVERGDSDRKESKQDSNWGNSGQWKDKDKKNRF